MIKNRDKMFGELKWIELLNKTYVFHFFNLNGTQLSTTD